MFQVDHNLFFRLALVYGKAARYILIEIHERGEVHAAYTHSDYPYEDEYDWYRVLDDIRFDDRTKSLLDDQKKQWFW